MSGEDDTTEISKTELERTRLVSELFRLKRKPEGKIGYVLLGLGLCLVALAYYFSHNVAAFLGVALTFWGALLLYIRPTHFIREEVLSAAVTGTVINYNRLRDELGFKGTPRYVSPGTLSGIQMATLWIPRSDDDPEPSDEWLSGDQVLSDDPPGVKFDPPGLGLHSLLESELGTNFSFTDIGRLPYSLEKGLIEGLELVESFDMAVEEPSIVVEVGGTVFNESLMGLIDLDGSGIVGDPFSGAIACILARSTRRPIVINGVERVAERRVMRIRYSMMVLPSEE